MSEECEERVVTHTIKEEDDSTTFLYVMMVLLLIFCAVAVSYAYHLHVKGQNKPSPFEGLVDAIKKLCSAGGRKPAGANKKGKKDEQQGEWSQADWDAMFAGMYGDPSQWDAGTQGGQSGADQGKGGQLALQDDYSQYPGSGGSASSGGPGSWDGGADDAAWGAPVAPPTKPKPGKGSKGGAHQQVPKKPKALPSMKGGKSSTGKASKAQPAPSQYGYGQQDQWDGGSGYGY